MIRLSSRLGIGGIQLLLLLLMLMTVSNTSHIQSEKERNSDVDYLEKTRISNIPDYSVLLSSNSSMGSFSSRVEQMNVNLVRETDYSGSKLTGSRDNFIEIRSPKLGEFNVVFVFLTSLHIQTNKSLHFVSRNQLFFIIFVVIFVPADDMNTMSISTTDTTVAPSPAPTGQPSTQPTSQPTGQPSRQPTEQPSRQPTGQPSRQPTGQPSTQPSSKPSKPTGQPSSQPTNPTGQPSRQPTGQPSSQPSRQPSAQPTTQPTSSPTAAPVAEISLGNCSSFAVQAGSAILFNLATTIIKRGSVGNSPGTSIGGSYRLVDGTTQSNTAKAKLCAADQKTAYLKASGYACTTTLASAYLSGTKLTGIYCYGTLEIAPFTDLTLDAKNNTRAVFLFIATTTVTTGKHSSITLKNGAQASNVFWAVGSSATLGSVSTFVGQLLATASTTVGEFALIGGRILVEASITFNSGSYVNVDYVHVATGNVNVTLGTCSSFAVLASTTVTFGDGQTVLNTGSVGAGTSITGNYSLTSGSTYAGTSSATTCAYDLVSAYNTASTATCEYYLTSSDLSTLTLTPGVYCSSDGTFSIGKVSAVTLNAQNVTSKVWVFQTITTLTIGSDASILFKNKALSKNVFWAIGSSVSLGYASFFAGNFLVYSSITIASFGRLDGRLLSMAAVSFVGYSTGQLPNGTSAVINPSLAMHLGRCEDFAVLAGTTLGFTGAMTVINTLSIGSSPGTGITGSYRLNSATASAQAVTTTAVRCAADLRIAIAALQEKTCGTTYSTAELSGKTLAPGVYCTTPGTFTVAIAGTLTLDASNVTGSLWVFQAATTLITGARSQIVLKNMAEASNVFWSIGTAATLGEASFFIGQLIASTAFTASSRSVLKGRALALTSVDFTSGSLVSQTASATSFSISVGTCENFTVLAGTNLQFLTGQTVLKTGSIGVSPGTSISGNYSLRSGSTYTNSAEAIDCAYDLAGTYNTASTATCEYYLSSSALTGLTLTSGVYCSTDGTFTIGKLGYVTLDAKNVTGAVWVFQTSSNVTTAASSSVIFRNEALAKNVYWAIAGNLNIGYDSLFAGNALVQSYIKFAAYSTFHGRALSLAAVTFAGFSTAGLPSGTLVTVYPTVSVGLGSCSAFAVMAGTTLGFELALTVVTTLSVGISPGTAITGNYRVEGEWVVEWMDE
jgi:outer membrane biosynthesis protein TonB